MSSPSATKEYKIVAVSGEGRRLLDARWGGQGVLSPAYRALTVGNKLLVGTIQSTVFVFDGQGREIAQARGPDTYNVFAGAADGSGRPVFVVDEDSCLIAYALE